MNWNNCWSPEKNRFLWQLVKSSIWILAFLMKNLNGALQYRMLDLQAINCSRIHLDRLTFHQICCSWLQEDKWLSWDRIAKFSCMRSENGKKPYWYWKTTLKFVNIWDSTRITVSIIECTLQNTHSSVLFTLEIDNNC